jgi:hypothetical protein
MRTGSGIGNHVCVKLDPANDMIETPSGLKLLVDTSYEPEKHIVRVGTVDAVPNRLTYHHKKPSYPWETEMELKVGDRVVMYFMAVQNCLAKEQKRYYQKGKDIWIFIKYHNIYAVIEKDNIRPINGYVLVEPVEDPAWVRMQEQAKKSNLELPDLRKPSKTDVTYGKIAYIGKPNKRYAMMTTNLMNTTMRSRVTPSL